MKTERKIYLSASIGNVLEFYDFALYGFYAPLFSKLFFPTSDPLVSLLISFSVFAVGFLCRPLGGLLFGLLGDYFKRTTSLAISLVGIGVATFCMGLLPTYSTWGIAAPICLSALRILQSLCIGGEFSNSLVFVSEHLDQYRAKYPALTNGLVISMGVLGWFIASMLAIVFVKEQGILSWRIPFLFGIVIAGIGFYIRSRIEDAHITKYSGSLGQMLKEIGRHPTAILGACAVGIFMGALFYGQLIFCNGYLPKVTPFSQKEIAGAVSIGFFSYMVLLPIAGWIADVLGHFKTIMGAIVLAMLVAPAFYFLEVSSVFATIVISQVLAAALLSFFMSPATYFMCHLFPTNIRCMGVSLSYNIGATLFGGLAPSVNLLLYQRGENTFTPAIFLLISLFLSGYFLVLAKKRVALRPVT